MVAKLQSDVTKYFQQDGRRIVIKLDQSYWDELKTLAKRSQITLNALVFNVVADLPDGQNKTAYLRRYCLGQNQRQMVLSKVSGATVDLGTILVACPAAALIVTSERRIIAYNPTFSSTYLKTDNGKTIPINKVKLSFNRPFNKIIQFMLSNPTKIIQGQMGITISDKLFNRTARFSLANRNEGTSSNVVIFLEAVER